MIRPSSLNYILAKWAILLSQYKMQFMPQKAVKGQVVANFLADHPVPGSSKLYNNLLDEIAEVWKTHHPQKNKYGNFSFTTHQEWVLEEIS